MPQLVKRLGLIVAAGVAFNTAGPTWAQTSVPNAANGTTERLQEQWEEYSRKGRGPAYPADRLIENRKALEVARQALEQEPTSVTWLHALWVSCLAYGETLEMLGKQPDALVLLREGKAVAERLVAMDPANATWREATAMFWSRIAGALALSGQAGDAVVAFREALAVQRSLIEAAPGDRRLRRDLMHALNNLGNVQLEQGHFTDAESSFREALAMAEELGPTQNEASRQGDLLAMYDGVGAALLAQGRAQAALEYVEKSLAIAERLVRENPGSDNRLYELSKPQDLMARAFLRQGDLEQAAQFFRAALVTRQRALALTPGNPMWLVVVANSFGSLGTVLALQGRVGEARDSFREGRHIVQRLGGPTDWFDEQLAKLN